MVEVDPSATKDHIAWEVQEGIKCADFLRRVYEEVCVYCIYVLVYEIHSHQQAFSLQL